MLVLLFEKKAVTKWVANVWGQWIVKVINKDLWEGKPGSIRLSSQLIQED